MGIRWLFAGWLIALGSPALADNAANLSSALQSARLELTLQHGALAGPAAGELQTAIASSRYVLIGEDHMSREIPQFTAAVCAAMAPDGLDGMAIETAPQATAFIAAHLVDGSAADRLAALITKYPDSVAFLNMRNEAHLVTQCARGAPPGSFHLWGLDQEFLGAAGWLLEMISQQKLSPEAASTVSRLRAEEARDADDARRTGSPLALFLVAANDNELSQAALVLRRGGDATANRLFSELVASHDLYAAHAGHRADSNRARGLLLKQTLLADLQQRAASKPPRVLIKFGESHLYKGFNDLHQRDLGNFVAELADGQGLQALHIAVLGADGSRLRYGGYARPPLVDHFSLATDKDYAWIKPAVDALLPSGWTVFDLRKLRLRNDLALDVAWERMVYGYDFLLLIPHLTPADPL
jgi:hypothetical protein